MKKVVIVLISLLVIILIIIYVNKNNSNTLVDEIKLNDYIELVPSNTNYEIDSSDTGYSLKQSINPSNLKLWQVIKINEDSIDVVSAIPSKEIIYFEGIKGIDKYIDTLNEIANSYKNDYVISARYITLEDYKLVKDDNKEYFIADKEDNNIKVVDKEGKISDYPLVVFDEKTGYHNQLRGFKLRPILTIKKDIKIINGDGKSSDTTYKIAS